MIRACGTKLYKLKMVSDILDHPVQPPKQVSKAYVMDGLT